MISRKIDETISLEIVMPVDAKVIFQLVDDNRVYLGEYLSWVANTRQEEDTVNFVKKSLDRTKEMTGIDYKILKDNAVIGIVGLFETNRDTRTFEIGYWIGEKHGRKGIISKTVPAVEEIGFGCFGARKIEIRCAVENIASNRVAQKAGYQLEGTLRNCGLIGTRFLDYNVYGKMRTS